jgi:hypothetical protein
MGVSQTSGRFPPRTKVTNQLNDNLWSYVWVCAKTGYPRSWWFSISFNGHWISRYFGIHHCNGFVWNHDTPFHPLITHHCEHCQKSIPFLEKSIFLGFFICFHHFSPSYPSWVTGLCSLSRPLLARFGPPAALFVTEESEPPGFFWDSVA